MGAGYNLAPYFYGWGYPVSYETDVMLSNTLPVWTQNPYPFNVYSGPPPPVRPFWNANRTPFLAIVPPTCVWPMAVLFSGIAGSTRRVSHVLI